MSLYGYTDAHVRVISTVQQQLTTLPTVYTVLLETVTELSLNPNRDAVKMSFCLPLCAPLSFKPCLPDPAQIVPANVDLRDNLVV